ncbi:cutinase family protein [Enemella sp. A6]|uniref:cutinase family protein n=1 Tax=Enemella sp. A6 TaxID=3440152 RepID=UPI003EBE584F
MHSVVRAALVGLAAVTLVAGPTAVPAAADTGLTWPDQPARSAGGECGDVLFIGVRGSGEEWPYGPTVERIRQVLVDRTSQVDGDRPRSRVREIALDFPAASPYTLTDIGVEKLMFSEEMPDNDYQRSVDAGRAELHRVLDDAAARCPGERWVLAGFSQGAQVITETLAERGEAPQLAGALLFGNPLHYPSQQVTEFGNGPDTAVGLVAAVHYLRETAQVARDDEDKIGLRAVIRTTLAMSEGDVAMTRMHRVARYHRMEIPEALKHRVVSVCNAGDIICDAGSPLARVMLGASTITVETDRARPIHQGYDERIIAESAEILIGDLLANLPEKPDGTTRPEADAATRMPVEAIGAIAGGGLLLAAGAASVLRRRRHQLEDTDWHLLTEDEDDDQRPGRSELSA